VSLTGALSLGSPTAVRCKLGKRGASYHWPILVVPCRRQSRYICKCKRYEKRNRLLTFKKFLFPVEPEK
jgi:hypothetical protein